MNDVTNKLFAPAFVDIIAEYGKKDAHVGDDEIDWIPYVVEGTYWKPMRFDVANGRVFAPLWFKQPGVLGRHQHHGSVLGYCVEGSWYYKEYDWVARPGSLISESPGGVHTLCSDTGMKTLFILEGQIDFFGDDNGFLEAVMNLRRRQRPVSSLGKRRRRREVLRVFRRSARNL